MIVRIMGEGQFELPDEAMERLNELDDAVESEVILPAEESTAEEVRAMLTDEGLIPD